MADPFGVSFRKLFQQSIDPVDNFNSVGVIVSVDQKSHTLFAVVSTAVGVLFSPQLDAGDILEFDLTPGGSAADNDVAELLDGFQTAQSFDFELHGVVAEFSSHSTCGSLLVLGTDRSSHIIRSNV